MKRKKPTAILYLPVLLLVAAAFANYTKGSHHEKPVVFERRVAIAEISPTEGNDTVGTVTFIEERNGVRIIADIRNLSAGKHGFHIHENGDCSAPDASSAGGHFNPHGEPHAAPGDKKRHVGDLGNLETTDAKAAMYERFDEHLSFEGASSILGKAVVIHDGEDDLESQPSGAAGPRIGCGVIELQTTQKVSKAQSQLQR